MNLNNCQPPAKHLLHAHNRTSKLLVGRLHSRNQHHMPRVACTCERRKMVGVEQDHELACRFFPRRGWARFLSASRIFRPASKICFITSATATRNEAEEITEGREEI